MTDFAISSIVRCNHKTVDQMMPWLLPRIAPRYPGAGLAWTGRLIQMAGQNDALFIRNNRAVGLFTAARNQLTGEVTVTEAFAVADEAIPVKGGRMIAPQGSESEEALILLYDFAVEWARGLLAKRFIVGVCSNLMFRQFVEEYSAERVESFVISPLEERTR